MTFLGGMIFRGIYSVMNEMKLLSDMELLSQMSDAVISERECLVFQLEIIKELDIRKLTFEYSSLKSFLVSEFKMSESDAERKIYAARLLKKFPMIREKLESGKLNITLLEITRGVAHREKLSEDEYLELLGEVEGMSCKAATKYMAKLYPQSAIGIKDKISPLNEEQSLISFVVENEFVDMLEEVRGILPYDAQATLGELFEYLVSDYLKRNHPEEKAKRAQKRKEQKVQKESEEQKAELQDSIHEQAMNERVEKQIETVTTHSAPSVTTRVASQSLRNELILQVGYVCAYVDPITQKKCQSRAHLEAHHQHSFSKGGETTLSNTVWVCNRHHARLSFLEFGDVSEYFKRNKTNTYTLGS